MSLLSDLLAASIRPSLAQLEIPVRLQHEDSTGKPLPLPSIVIEAVDIDDAYQVRHNGRTARNCTLSIHVRVADAPGAADALRALASKVESVIEPNEDDWSFFQPFREADEQSVDGATRITTLHWRLVLLPSES